MATVADAQARVEALAARAKDLSSRGRSDALMHLLGGLLWLAGDDQVSGRVLVALDQAVTASEENMGGRRG